MEEDDRQLIEEEKDLTHNLKTLQEKHKDIKLIYENIIDNIRSLGKNDMREEATLNNSTIDNKSHVDLSNIVEDDIIRQYNDILANMKNKVETLFMTQTHDEFKEIMRIKGYEPNTNRIKNKGRSAINEDRDDRLYNELKKEKSEYERNDDLLKDEDAKIYKARSNLIEEYKRKEDEKLKAVEKEKTAKK
jgi:hypothetical protein